METDEPRDELISRATKAIIQDRNGFAFSTRKQSSDFSLVPDTNMNRVLEVVQQDPVVRGAITTLVDRTLEPGFAFYGKDKKSRNAEANDKMRELRFETLMRQLLQQLFTYNNIFIEVVKLGTTPKELHLIDPRNLEIQTNKHGEIVRYVQNAGESVVTWEPEEVVHLKTTPLGGAIWGDVDMKALWVTCALKYHIKKLFLWQYETNQFRPLLNLKNATDDQVRRFLTFLEGARADIKKLVPIEGEVETIFLDQMQDYTKVKALLTYLDYEILNLLQVPPIAVGLPDNSNRSNTDGQDRAFNTRIKAVHRAVEDIISNDLMPKLGFEKVTLKFNVIDDLAMQKYLEMAKIMKDMQFKEELIKDFLESKGWDFPEGTIFDEMMQESLNQPNNENSPSRQGKAAGAANKRIGTGERSTTRDNQLVTRTAEPSWKKFGTIEYEVEE